jgi:hypothetical protein
MDAEAILHELTDATDLPREALQAASARRAELLPTFLGVIEDYLGQQPTARADPGPLFFIFHLLVSSAWRVAGKNRLQTVGAFIAVSG